MTILAALQTLIAQGESATLELQRSTAELKRGGETLCAFLNGEGGKVLVGVAPDGKLVGQDVAHITLRDIAAMLGRFEPPARVDSNLHTFRAGWRSSWEPSGRTDRTSFRDQSPAPLTRGRAARDDHSRQAA